MKWWQQQRHTSLKLSCSSFMTTQKINNIFLTPYRSVGLPFWNILSKMKCLMAFHFGGMWCVHSNAHFQRNFTRNRVHPSKSTLIWTIRVADVSHYIQLQFNAATFINHMLICTLVCVHVYFTSIFPLADGRNDDREKEWDGMPPFISPEKCWQAHTSII